jgi:hypothetical protein
MAIAFRPFIIKGAAMQLAPLEDVMATRHSRWQPSMASSTPRRNHYIKKHIRFLQDKANNRSILT